MSWIQRGRERGTLCEHFHSGKVPLLAFQDLSAVHAILLTALSAHLESTALSWFKLDQYSRFQTVSGSVQGPVFFTLCTTPLASVISCHNLNHCFYADDSQLFNSA